GCGPPTVHVAVERSRGVTGPARLRPRLTVREANAVPGPMRSLWEFEAVGAAEEPARSPHAVLVPPEIPQDQADDETAEQPHHHQVEHGIVAVDRLVAL